MTLFHYALPAMTEWNFWNYKLERALSSLGLFAQVRCHGDEKTNSHRELLGTGVMATAVTVGDDLSWISDPGVLRCLSCSSTGLPRTVVLAEVAYLMLFWGNECPFDIQSEHMDEELAGGWWETFDLWKLSDFFIEHILFTLTASVTSAALWQNAWQKQPKGGRISFNAWCQNSTFRAVGELWPLFTSWWTKSRE